MAQTKSRQSSKSGNKRQARQQSPQRKQRQVSRSTDGRSSSQKPEEHRFAQNLAGEGTVAEQIYQRYAAEGGEESGDAPDVLLDVPVVKVDSIHLEVESLSAHVALQAKVLDLLNLNVGVNVELGKVRLDIKGVEAQALAKVRLEHVAAILDRTLTTLDRNPELLESLGQSVEQVGSGAGQTLSQTGEAVDQVGEGAEGAVEDVGQGAGQATGELGEGAGESAEQLGEGAENLGAAGRAKTFAKQLGSSAADEVREVGEVASRKAHEIGERRRERRHGGDVDATDAAWRTADELGVDIDDVEGSGAGGRITVQDVRDAG